MQPWMALHTLYITLCGVDVKSLIEQFLQFLARVASSANA